MHVFEAHVWFSLSPYLGSGGQPTLPELLRLDVPEGIGTNYSKFGVLILNDNLGNQVDVIEEEYHGKPVRICRKILQEWLAGKGLRPVTWETLVQTLRDTKLTLLADKIQSEKL